MKIQLKGRYRYDMKILSNWLLTFFALTLLSTTTIAAESLMDRINSLEPIIGNYPPTIKDEANAHAVKQQYLELKKELDIHLAQHAKDPEWLFMRGYLQGMGHNLDDPGTWQGATHDLKAVLKINPAHIPAMLALGRLWVNSDLTFAHKAETLFRSAQCYQGSKPLEEAQRGIFFALYYQGKMQDALRQSEYLKQTWPQSEPYRKLNKTTRSVLSQSADQPVKRSISGPLNMATCHH